MDNTKSDFPELPFNNADMERLVEDISKKIEPLIKTIMEVARICVEKILSYPNKRVLHLVKHGKPRVRKKNMRRIIKWLQEGKNDTNKR